MAVTSEDWLQAQCSVLGSALISPELVPKVLTETVETDYNGTCRNIYKTLKQLFIAGKSVDVVSVAAAMGSEYRDYLIQLMEITPSAAGIDHYITLCREQARILKAQEVGRRIADAEDSDSIRKLLEEVSSLMVNRPAIQVTTMEDALKSFMTRHTGKVDYLTWPIRELNSELYAEPGDFIILGGRPSAGKSAWALQCAWHWAQKYKVGFFSLETSSEKLFDRQMSAVARIAMSDIKRNDIPDSAWQSLAAMNQEIISTNLEIIRAAGMSPADIRAMTVTKGYQIIIVDYLQLLQSSGENRTTQVTNISIALHTMAQSLGVTVVALSQLAREGQQGGKQGMSALRESGQIEQDADVVMILSLEKQGQPSGNRIMSIEKNKEGTCPNILLAFDGMHQTFSKAVQTGNTLQAMTKARKKDEHQSSAMDQIKMLPNDYPVPWDCGGRTE